MVLLAGLVGLGAGLAAAALQALSQAVSGLTLELFAGYSPRAPSGEWSMLGELRPILGGFSPGLLLVVITLGGLVSGAIVHAIAPEAEGHGTDAAIRAYHHGGAVVRPAVPLAKLVSSAVTLGTGGSGGREGPITQIGAGLGSLLASFLRLSESERRMLFVAGMGAGVAAIFRVPLAGAIFATEVLYRGGDFEAEALVPSVISSAVAYCVFDLVGSGLFGAGAAFEPLFPVRPGLTFDDPLLLGPLTLLAVAMAAASFLYVRSFYGSQGLFRRLRLSPRVKPAVGGLATGLVALAIFFALSGLGAKAQQDSLGVLSTGYGLLQELLDGTYDCGHAAGAVVLAVVGLGKMLTTALTIGSGGSAGVFGPSMVIGGALGGAVGAVMQALFPSVVSRTDTFVILGMAGFFSAAAKVPLSTIVMVCELTAGYGLLLPAMWVSALAYLLGRNWSIYSEQVLSRLHSPAHRGELVVGVLDGVAVGEIWRPEARELVAFPPDAPLSKVMEAIPLTSQTVFPVLGADGRYCGLVGLNQVRRVIYENDLGALAVVGDVMEQGVRHFRLETDLSVVMAEFARSEYDELPVVDEESGRVLGLLRRREVLAAYDARLARLRSGRA